MRDARALWSCEVASSDEQVKAFHGFWLRVQSLALAATGQQRADGGDEHSKEGSVLKKTWEVGTRFRQIKRRPLGSTSPSPAASPPHVFAGMCLLNPDSTTFVLPPSVPSRHRPPPSTASSR